MAVINRGFAVLGQGVWKNMGKEKALLRRLQDLYEKELPSITEGTSVATVGGGGSSGAGQGHATIGGNRESSGNQAQPPAQPPLQPGNVGTPPSKELHSNQFAEVRDARKRQRLYNGQWHCYTFWHVEIETENCFKTNRYAWQQSAQAPCHPRPRPRPQRPTLPGSEIPASICHRFWALRILAWPRAAVEVGSLIFKRIEGLTLVWDV